MKGSIKQNSRIFIINIKYSYLKKILKSCTYIQLSLCYYGNRLTFHQCIHMQMYIYMYVSVTAMGDMYLRLC